MDMFLQWLVDNGWIPATAVPIILIFCITLFKIIKIKSGNAVLSAKVRKVEKENKEYSKSVNNLETYMIIDADAEIVYLENSKKNTINKKQKAVIETRIKEVKAKKDCVLENKFNREKALSNPELEAKKKKVRVKIKKQDTEVKENIGNE